MSLIIMHWPVALKVSYGVKRAHHCIFAIESLEDDFFEKVAFGEEDDDDGSHRKITKESNLDLLDTEAEDILRSIGLYRNRQRSVEDTEHHEMPPMNRYWLHDTPGAINDAQV